MKRVGYKIESRDDNEYPFAKVVCTVTCGAYDSIKLMLSKYNKKYDIKPHLLYDSNGDWMVIMTAKVKKKK